MIPSRTRTTHPPTCPGGSERLRVRTHVLLTGHKALCDLFASCPSTTLRMRVSKRLPSLRCGHDLHQAVPLTVQAGIRVDATIITMQVARRTEARPQLIASNVCTSHACTRSSLSSPREYKPCQSLQYKM